jgi:hypothetical protein
MRPEARVLVNGIGDVYWDIVGMCRDIYQPNIYGEIW